MNIRSPSASFCSNYQACAHKRENFPQWWAHLSSVNFREKLRVGWRSREGERQRQRMSEGLKPTFKVAMILFSPPLSPRFLFSLLPVPPLPFSFLLFVWKLRGWFSLFKYIVAILTLTLLSLNSFFGLHNLAPAKKAVLYHSLSAMVQPMETNSIQTLIYQPSPEVWTPKIQCKDNRGYTEGHLCTLFSLPAISFVCFVLVYFVFFFSLQGHTQSIRKFPGWGLNRSCSLGLHLPLASTS